jgi:hypothetical protein
MSSNGVVNLADIARKLEVSPQSVSNWKARDRVPYKYVVEGSEQIQAPSAIEYNSQVWTEQQYYRDQENSGLPDACPLHCHVLHGRGQELFFWRGYLMPVAQTFGSSSVQRVVMTMVGVMMFLFFVDSYFLSVNKSRNSFMLLPPRYCNHGGHLTLRGGGGSASGILGRLGISVPSAGGGGPHLHHLDFAFSVSRIFENHRFAKRLWEKSSEPKNMVSRTLLEIALREERKRLNKPSTFHGRGPMNPLLLKGIRD